MFKNNYIKSDYLLSCDTTNKYNLLSRYDVPEVKNIVLEFPLKNIINAFESKMSEEDNVLQIKAFLFFYLLFNTLPFINSNKLKIIKKSDKDNESFFSLKIKVSEKKEINKFIIQLFIENIHNFLLEDFKLLQEKNLYQLNNKNKILLSCKIPLNLLADNESVLNTLTGINDKDFILNTTFHIQKKFKVKDTKKFIKNNTLFWING